jgi:hypothetical protein
LKKRWRRKGRETIFLAQGKLMKGSKIAPWISIFAGLLWFFAALMADERRRLSVTLGLVFLLVGLAQLKINRGRFKEEKDSPPNKDAG